MLVLPVDEATWGFRACLYIGMALLVLDVVLPRVFDRRVRLRWPFQRPRQLALPRVRPMAEDHFRRRRRELERKIRALERGEDDVQGGEEGIAAEKSDDAAADESNARRQAAKEKKPLKKKKTKRRVKMPGDKTETEGDESDAAALRRRATKRVSFGTARSALDESTSQRQRLPFDDESKTRESPIVETVQPLSRNPSPAAVAAAAVAVPSPPRTATASMGPQDAALPKPPVRSDPFSLVDDTFPWQLPNYARMAPAPSTTVAQAPQPAISGSPVVPHGITLNVRRPLGHFNGSTQPSGLSPAALPGGNPKFTLELKHKPFWKRTPTKERSPSPAKAYARGNHASLADGPQLSVAGSVPAVLHNSFGSSSSLSRSTVTVGSTGSEAPQLHSDSVLRPSPRPQRTQPNAFASQSWRVPSPKPPLHSRPAATHAPPAVTSTSDISTPVAPQNRHKTPKIIRRITFDEDMMGALATPSDVSPLITQSMRKRQRENDVEEAYAAVGIPHGKRRFNN